MNPKDLNYEYNTKGYMLYYKDHPIGGAGIDKHAKGCRANLKLFRDLAELEKNKLLSGRGEKRYLDEIRKIDSEHGA